MQEILHLVSLAQAIRESLEKDFGTSFAIWSKQDVWQPLNACDFSEREDNLTDKISKLLRKHPIEDTAKTFIFSSDQQVLALPINGTTTLRLLVVGIIGTRDLALARALADTTLRATQQALQTSDAQARLNQSLVQITADFEELSWLRSLSDHFKDYDVRYGIDQVCGSVMPALIELIDAESIALFGTPNSQKPDASFPLLYCCGESTLPNEFLQELLKQSVEKEVCQAVVWNASNYANHGQLECPVKNYILVPLRNGSKHYGWLIALNKVCSPQLLAAFDNSNCDRNCYEFGTGEAGLMHTLALMLATHGRNNELYREKESLLVGVIQSLVNTIDAKDAYTCGHSDRVASMSKRIAREMGFSDCECEQVHMAGLLHDIGKIGVPDTVLGKPEKLTEDEFNLVKKHPTIGFEILKHLKPLEYALPGVLYHHETMDGQGYPFGLIGEQIPLLGRIIAVADSYDAMTSDRIYRKGLSTVVAEDVLLKGCGTQWDGVVVEAFFAARADIHAICGTGPAQVELTRLPCDGMIQYTAAIVN